MIMVDFDDIVYGKRTKKQKKRDVIADNRRKGKAAEDLVKLKYTIRGYEVNRTGRGSDYRVTKRDLLTGRVTDNKLVEVKSGKAKLSKLQKKTKKKKSNYKVEHAEPYVY